MPAVTSYTASRASAASGGCGAAPISAESRRRARDRTKPRAVRARGLAAGFLLLALARGSGAGSGWRRLRGGLGLLVLAWAQSVLRAGPRDRLARLPRWSAPAGPRAHEQRRERPEPEQLNDGRCDQRQHEQRTQDDSEHAHEAAEQAGAHCVQAD